MLLVKIDGIVRLFIVVLGRVIRNWKNLKNCSAEIMSSIKLEIIDLSFWKTRTRQNFNFLNTEGKTSKTHLQSQAKNRKLYDS